MAFFGFGDADGSPCTTSGAAASRRRLRATVRVAVIVRDTEAVLEGDFVDVDDFVTDAELDKVSVL